MITLITLLYADSPAVCDDPPAPDLLSFAVKALCFLIGSGVLVWIIQLIFSSGKYCKTVDRIEADVKGVTSKVETLINAFNCLVTELRAAKIIKGIKPLFAAGSPQNITETGKKVLTDCGLISFIETNKSDLIKKIESAKPQTNYDIEKQSIDLIMSYIDDPRINTVKDYSYQHAEFALATILTAGGLYLRNLYMKEKGLAP
ncbi:MAG: hypothetical protein WC738_03735 [Candidatus Omnitrophota bacterium]|jgi:hypothetical protein